MNFKLFLEQNLKSFGAPANQFPEPPPFWMPKYMDMYPKDAGRDVQSRVMASFPNQAANFYAMIGRIVMNYVHDWSMNPKNVEKRILELLSDKNPDGDMGKFLDYKKTILQKLNGFAFQYPNPVKIPDLQGMYSWLKTVPREQYT